LERQLGDGESIADHIPNVVPDVEENQAIVEPFPGGWSLSELGTQRRPSARHVGPLQPDPLGTIAKVGEGRQHLAGARENQIQSQFVRLVLWELERTDSTKSVVGA